jgi:hypothetical protein
MLRLQNIFFKFYYLTELLGFFYLSSISIYNEAKTMNFTIFLLSLFYCKQNICQVNRQCFRRTSWWSRYVPFFVYNVLMVVWNKRRLSGHPLYPCKIMYWWLYGTNEDIMDIPYTPCKIMYWSCTRYSFLPYNHKYIILQEV